jgi:hypothetical protein
MKYDRQAQKRGVPMTEAIGRLKMTATTDEEGRILAMLFEALIEGHPIELPHRNIVIGLERVQDGAGLVGNHPAEAVGAGADDALAVGKDDAEAVRVDDALAIAARDDDSVEVHGRAV